MTNEKMTVKQTVVLMIKVAAACFLGAFSFYQFTVNAHLIPGGFTGIGAVVELATKGTVVGKFLTAGIVGIILNVPLYIMSYKGGNKRFFWFSVYGMATWSVMVEIVGRVIPPNVLNLTFEHKEIETLLYAIIAGVASGVASGYIIRLGFSTGGSELLGTLINKRMPFIKIGTVTNAIKFFVIVIYAVFVSGDYLAERIVVSLMSGVISSYMVDMLVDGFRAAKAYYIISTKPSELSAAIYKGLNRSSTLFSGEGALLHTEQKMLMCIVYNSEVARLRAIVHRVDGHAFMFSTTVKEAYGTGFSEQRAPFRLPFVAQRDVVTGERISEPKKVWRKVKKTPPAENQETEENP